MGLLGFGSKEAGAHAASFLLGAALPTALLFLLASDRLGEGLSSISRFTPDVYSVLHEACTCRCVQSFIWMRVVCIVTCTLLVLTLCMDFVFVVTQVFFRGLQKSNLLLSTIQLTLQTKYRFD